MENVERFVEVNQNGRDISLENKLNLHIGRIYRVQTAYVIHEGSLKGFTVKATKQETTLHKIELRNGFVFDFRYLGTEWEEIIPFIDKFIDYGNFSVKSYKEI